MLARAASTALVLVVNTILAKISQEEGSQATASVSGYTIGCSGCHEDGSSRILGAAAVILMGGSLRMRRR